MSDDNQSYVFCSQCGNRIKADSRFCRFCGVKLEQYDEPKEKDPVNSKESSAEDSSIIDKQNPNAEEPTISVKIKTDPKVKRHPLPMKLLPILK